MKPDKQTKNPVVVLGITGSIAAYKMADVVSKLVQSDIDTHVMMTEAATRLVQPQTFLTLSRNRVTTSLWNIPDWQPEHIALSDCTDLLVIAPATANLLGKLANGIADDALSTFALSFSGSVLVAPAMNPRMWQHPAVQHNCATLKQRGVRFIEPAAGRVACGNETGPGRLAPPTAILQAIKARLAVQKANAVSGKPRKILITAGPTREWLDPARYLTNRSSGKMGYALAEAAHAAGHQVTLISGPVELAAPAGIQLLPVVTAAEMAAAVEQEFPACDVLFMSGAVADYRPADMAPAKIKKTDGPMHLEMERTRDILMSLEEKARQGHTIVGFAAETDHLDDYARSKLTRKHLDWIVANDISRSDIGFGTDENEVRLLGANGTELTIPFASKIDVAARILAITLP